LSLQSAVLSSLVRHRRDGWDVASRPWVQSECESVGLAPIEPTLQRLEQLIDAVRERLGVPVLVYNPSPVIPGERTHCWLGADDALGLRVRRFNVGLVELSTRQDFSIVDVDRLMACAGAERLKVDMVHLSLSRGPGSGMGRGRRRGAGRQ
jgi:hypothetical protein